MSTPRTFAVAASAALACWCSNAQAYRPFDGTDAAVADRDQLEIELGPVEYRREDAERALFAPDTVFNYGFATDWEAVLQGQVAHSLVVSVAPAWSGTARF